MVYPERDAYDSRMLEVSGGHQLYVEQSGNPTGLPVVLLHGGPGSGADPQHRSYFCPRRYRLVIFDQRGAGRSVPSGRVEANTTPDLVADMERIRELLGIESWVLFGGSWGATLALVYALAHPERVLAMVLRGCFLARQEDLHWFAGGALERFFPEAWQELLAVLPAGTTPLQSLPQGILGTDPVQAAAMALAWARWSGTVVRFSLSPQEDVELCAGEVLNMVRIEMHYGRHGYFLQENELLNRARELPQVPVRILHGRRDLTCVPRCAWQLHRAMPGSELVYIADAGHLSSEPPMAAALVEATDYMAERLG